MITIWDTLGLAKWIIIISMLTNVFSHINFSLLFLQVKDL